MRGTGQPALVPPEQADRIAPCLSRDWACMPDSLRATLITHLQRAVFPSVAGKRASNIATIFHIQHLLRKIFHICWPLSTVRRGKGVDLHRNGRDVTTKATHRNQMRRLVCQIVDIPVRVDLSNQRTAIFLPLTMYMPAGRPERGSAEPATVLTAMPWRL